MIKFLGFFSFFFKNLSSVSNIVEQKGFMHLLPMEKTVHC